MYRKIFFIFFIFLFITECSKKEEISVKPPDNKEAYKIYGQALRSYE